MIIKTQLCIPPDYEYGVPPLGTPALVGYLKTHGFPVTQADYNIAYRDFLWGKVTVKLDKKLLRPTPILKHLLKKHFAEKLQNRYYSHLLPDESRDDLGMPFLAYNNNTNSSFYFTERLLASPNLLRYLNDVEENTFYQFFTERGVVEGIIKQGINLLGISVTSPSQVIPTFTLCNLVKKRNPKLKIILGGQWVSLYRNELVNRPDLVSLFDGFICFEGETPLARLIYTLQAEESLNCVPNLIYRADNRWVVSPLSSQENLDQLPAPDFEGLPLKEYDASGHGKVTLPFEASRGCYWGRCDYCVDLPLPKPRYRRKTPALVVRDIKILLDRYPVTDLMFSDPALAPQQMKAVSEHLIAEGIKIKWWTMARCDSQFTEEIFALAAQAGCRKINFGFESANDRVCAFVHKGNHRETSLRVIHNCHNAGIEVYLQCMLGLPTETVQEGLDTVQFLIEHRQLISCITFNVYYLTPCNHVYNDPAHYGLEYKKDPALPFKFFTEFTPTGDMMTQAEAHNLQKLCWGLMDRYDNPPAPEINLDKKPVLAKEVYLIPVAFTLNTVSSENWCLLNKTDGSYLMMDEQEKKLIELTKDRFSGTELMARLKDVRPLDTSAMVQEKFEVLLKRLLREGFIELK